MKDTKKRILKAAEELLSQKGVSDTTIAEIAKKANVVDSHAYQYFKGKKGLVFGVAEERLRESVAVLTDQLQGIIDPKSRLSKYIWFGLHYNDTHRDYVRNLMFDYRSNPDFYKTPAYTLVREHAKICGDILKQGIDSGDFRKDMDYRLIREIIYGTLDAEAISQNSGSLKKSKKKRSKTTTDLLLAKNPKSPYPIYLLLKKSDGFAQDKLISAAEILGEADKKLKTSSQSPKLVLEKAILSICKM